MTADSLIVASCDLLIFCENHTLYLHDVYWQPNTRAEYKCSVISFLARLADQCLSKQTDSFWSSSHVLQLCPNLTGQQLCIIKNIVNCPTLEQTRHGVFYYIWSGLRKTQCFVQWWRTMVQIQHCLYNWVNVYSADACHNKRQDWSVCIHAITYVWVGKQT